jgi:hypothetical protein
MNFARNGNPMNDNPVSQCQVTLNACIDIAAHKRWAALSGKEAGDGVQFPFGKEIPKASTGVVVHEIAVKRRNNTQTLSKTKRRKIDPMLTPALTNLAGCPLNLKENEENVKGKVENEFWKQYQLTGVVKTSRDVLNPDGTDVDYGRIDFALGIGGIDPVLNNGEKNIYAGGLVVCRTPFEDKGKRRVPVERGTDEGKMLLITEPYDYKQIVSVDSIKEIFNTFDDTELPGILKDNSEMPLYKCISNLSDLMGGLPSVRTDIMSGGKAAKLIHSFFECQYEYNSRVIGVALTDSQPGQQFDLKVSAFGYCL